MEDSLDDVELVLLELEKAGVQIQHTTVEDSEQFRAALANQTFDAVLSDCRLPKWSGMDVLGELRGRDKNTPFLLVTGTLGEEAAVECSKTRGERFRSEGSYVAAAAGAAAGAGRQKVAGRKR